jgi:uncharacterized protein (TIGR01777 family)
VADRRWTARYKAEVRASRVLGTRALAGALAKLSPRPATLVAASAIGWYGDTGGREVDESAPSGQSFLARLVRDWEAAAGPAADAGIRVVHPRSGLVLTPHGGLLARMLPLARLGVLPRFSSGRQVMSWISLPDEIAALTFLLGREDVSGPVNLTAPAPVTNAEFTAALTAAVGRRNLPWLRVPAPALRLAVGEASVELLTSARVTSRRLQQAGYEFRFPTLPEALAAGFLRLARGLRDPRGGTRDPQVPPAGEERQPVEHRDEDEQPAVPDDQGGVLEDPADHRAEQVGPEGGTRVPGVAETLGEDHVGEEDRREGDDHRGDEPRQRRQRQQ